MSEAQTGQESREAPPRARTRTCVGCGEQVAGEPGDLVRLVLGPGGEIAVDARGGGFGRGAYVHARRACLERAVKGGLARSAKAKVDRIAGLDDPAGAPADGPAAGAPDAPADSSSPLRVDSLARAIQAAMDRRMEGLLSAAVRSRQLARGADAVTGACQRGEAALVVVACDAAAAADLTEVRRAVAEGRAVAWGTKAGLGRLVQPGRRPARPDGGGGDGAAGVAVVAVTSPRIAGALHGTAQAAAACAEIACAPGPEGGQRPPGGARPGTAKRRSH